MTSLRSGLFSRSLRSLAFQKVGGGGVKGMGGISANLCLGFFFENFGIVLCMESEIAKRKRHGAPAVLDKGTVDALCKQIEIGMGYGDACAAVGVHRRTWLEWRKRAERGELGDLGDYIIERLREADIAYKKRLVEGVWDAIRNRYVIRKKRRQKRSDGTWMEEEVTEERPPDWRVAAFLLERKWPEEYGKKYVPGSSHVSINVGGGEVDVGKMSDEDIDRELASLADRRGKVIDAEVVEEGE